VRTFMQKPKPTQQTMSAKSTISGRAHFEQSRKVDSMLHLQHTIGNQAVQQMMQTNAEELEEGLASTILPRFAHDFSQIPVHPKSPAYVQAKLRISSPGNSHEQEADRISEQMMRMPEPRRQRAGACGGECHNAPTEQLGQEHERVQSKGIGSGDLGLTAAPPIVHEVLGSPGQALNPTTRAFMEPRFGHDFSRVRVHTDNGAAAAAKAVNATAFTVGEAIFFGVGQYSPATNDGRRLLAHELTHTVQQAAPSNQLRPARFPSSLSPGSVFIQRSPDRPMEVERKREQRIAELAKWPSEARNAWRRLDEFDRNLVVLQMAAKYGEPFAREFLKQVAKGKPQDDVEHYFGPGVGPKQEKLLAGGYQLAQKDSVHEWWVHPSGKSVTRNYTEDRAKPKEVKRVETPEEIIDVEELDPSDLQEQALALLDELRKLNREMEELLKAEPVDMEEFVDKASDFSDLRGEIHDLIVQDPTILEDVTGASIRDERKALVDWFLKLREKAYGTEMPDFNKPSSE
jgi:hypothetical protein